ncbi:MAG: GntR family transcriptional regulator [Rhodobacteraceae bacterium PARR1]|nr:MAG: GntR family transcriptional regulator [Rhodobacteraceae bacterium PARR1]
MSGTRRLDLQMIEPPQRETLQDRVYKELRNALMRGRFLPGTSLSIRAVSAALGTSPMPVREAMRQLTNDNAIITLPNRTYGTPIMSRSRFRDVLEIRSELEGYAVLRATERATLEDIDLLVSIDAEMAVRKGKGDREGYTAANQEFHFTLYRLAGSETLVPLIETMWLQYGPYLSFVFKAQLPTETGKTDFHAGAIAALRARDGQAARQMIVDDLLTYAKIIEASGKFSD